MKNYLQAFVMMVATLFATSAMAFTPPPSPKPASNILDQAHVLTPGELARLNDQLRQVNSTSANEIGVLILPSLDGQDIRDIGYTTGRAWGVGKSGLDNGVMIVWSPTDRKIGIETGKGVEGDLPDLKCNDIIRNVIGPNFRNKQYEQGLSSGFVAIASAIADHRRELADRQAADSQHSPTTHSSGDCQIGVAQAGLGSGLFWLFVLGGAFLFLRSRARAAHRRQEQKTEDQHTRYLSDIERNKVVEESLRRTQVPAPQPVSHPAPVRRVETPVVSSVVVPVVAAAVATTAFTDNMALAEDRERQARLRQLDLERQEREREEARQARSRQLEEERRQREQEEESNSLAAAAVAAAVVSSSSSDDDDDSSSSSGGSIDFGSDSGSSSDSGSGGDFGGGDFGGGGSADSY